MPVIDAHAHLDERMLDVPTLLGQMDARSIDRVVLIPCMNDPLPETPERLLAVMRRLLDSPAHPLVRLIHRQTMTKEGHLRLGGKTFRIYPKPDNAAVAAALSAHPDRFWGWVFLNPNAGGDVRDELERWRSVPGFVGVKLHPHWHNWPIAAALPLARRCEELGMPILIHLGFGSRGNWRALADACPRLSMVFAHAGIPHFRRMWPALRDNPRLFLDVSSAYLDEKLVRSAATAVGPQQILYGTDAPYGFPGATGTYDYGAIRGWVERLPIASAAIDDVLGNNFLRIIRK